MLMLDENLPEGALVPEGASVTDSVARLGGHWWSSEPRLVTVKDGAIAALRPRAGSITLRPVKDNQGAARLLRHAGCEVIAGSEEVQAGFVSEHRLSCARMGLIAVFVAPDLARHTLAALDSNAAGSTAVLGVAEGVLTLKDRKADVGLELPLMDARTSPQVAFAQFGAGEMALSRDGHVFMRAPAGEAFAPGGVELFLGCLRERAGLTMTLGPHRIADLIVLPDIDLTDPDHALLRAAFKSYALEIFADAV